MTYNLQISEQTGKIYDSLNTIKHLLSKEIDDTKSADRKYWLKASLTEAKKAETFLMRSMSAYNAAQYQE